MFKVFLIIFVLTIVSLADTPLYNAPLLKTGQTKSYNAAGNVVMDGSVKDDGYYRAGIARDYNRSSEGPK
jgi:hypothetical protein